MNNPQVAEAHIKLISKKPVEGKMDYATIGGFTVQTPDGKDICFDWSRFDGNHYKTTNGHAGIQWTLSDFDSEHFEDNAIPLDWKQIVESVLTEVVYENGHYDEITREETHVPMVLVEFKIVAYNEDYSESETYAFTPNQIADFNKRENAVTS